MFRMDPGYSLCKFRDDVYKRFALSGMTGFEGWADGGCAALFATCKRRPLERDANRAMIAAHHLGMNVGRFHGAAQQR